MSQRTPVIKLPVRIARQLEDRILSEGWPVGHQIGREASLAADMGVCRHTMREAVRILEGSGFVESRKGAKGGLFVAAEAYDFTCKTVTNYLEFFRIDPDEMTGIHRTLMRFMIIQAGVVLSDEQRGAMRAQLEELAQLSPAQRIPATEDLHHAVLNAVGNPALDLFIGVLDRMMLDASIFSTLDDDQWREMPGALIGVSQALLAALFDGRQDDALSINERYVEACANMVRASSLTGSQRATDQAAQRAYDFLPRAKPVKKAERVEREIRDMIITQGWPVGQSLGSETELSNRFEVGRSVLREALRSLEQLGIVEMGRGGRSGLRVKSPNPATVTETCRRYLRRERLTRDQAASLRSAMDAIEVGDGAHMKHLFVSVLP